MKVGEGYGIPPEHGHLRISLGIVIFLLSCTANLSAQATVVRGSLAEEGKPVADGVISLRRLEDESCAKLFGADVSLTEAEVKRARTCEGRSQLVNQVNTDERGDYKFDGLRPGWYLIQIRWPMAKHPDSKKPVGCSIQGWSISYVPLEEAGKSTGFVQAPSFELDAGGTKTLDFNYAGDFTIEKTCSNPLKWKKG